VTSATFRHPGLLAVQVAQVDEMSGGRVELGLGAGWSQREHTAYGISFPESAGERFDRLEEQLAVITGLWETPFGARFTHEGRNYTLFDSPALPKPVQTPVPMVIGGTGRRRTPELAVRYALDFNLPFVSVQESASLFENVRVVAGGRARSLHSHSQQRLGSLRREGWHVGTSARRSHRPRPGPVAQRRPRRIAGRNRRQDRPVRRCGYQPGLSSGARPA
jgi:alkanesulfonate monooxygenase SsuD/methylene tetrahydromethanopterin reductase-like flavin-dependent oxidoreductase (luciferase family)